MSNEELYQQAMDAITRLFSDKSVSVSTARENLNSLIGKIEILLDSLPEE
jgi:hypothetical protein